MTLRMMTMWRKRFLIKKESCWKSVATGCLSLSLWLLCVHVMKDRLRANFKAAVHHRLGAHRRTYVKEQRKVIIVIQAANVKLTSLHKPLQSDENSLVYWETVSHWLSQLFSVINPQMNRALNRALCKCLKDRSHWIWCSALTADISSFVTYVFL